jgi:hypothetical protein
MAGTAKALRISTAYLLLGVRFGAGALAGWPAVLVLGVFVCRGRLAQCRLDGMRRTLAARPGPVRVVCRCGLRR